ncbi:MAG: FeoC-like transcriptional regulator [Gammaproteobacteria bacterium]
MNLIEIKNYLMRVRIASLSSLCVYFNCDSDLLRCMLSHWTKKGCVRKFAKSEACGGACVKCGPQMMEIYEWLEPIV